MLSIVWDILKNLFSKMWENKQMALTILLAILCIFLIWSGYKKDEKINHLIHDTNALNEAKRNLEEEMAGLSLKLTFKGRNFDVLVRGKNGEIAHRSGYIPDEGSITFKEFRLTQSNFITRPDGTVVPINNVAPNGVSSTVETKVVTKVIDQITDGWWEKTKIWLHEAFIGPVINGGHSKIGIVDRGLTFRPGLGLIYDKKQPYGVNLGIDAKLLYFQRLSAGLGITPDVAYAWGSTHIDKLTFGIVNNFELMIGYGVPYNGSNNGTQYMIGLRSNF